MKTPFHYPVDITVYITELCRAPPAAAIQKLRAELQMLLFWPTSPSSSRAGDVVAAAWRQSLASRTTVNWDIKLFACVWERECVRESVRERERVRERKSERKMLCSKIRPTSFLSLSYINGGITGLRPSSQLLKYIFIIILGTLASGSWGVKLHEARWWVDKDSGPWVSAYL